jgi:hypothetical protein
MLGFCVSARLTASAKEIGTAGKLFADGAAEAASAHTVYRMDATKKANRGTLIKLVGEQIPFACIAFCIRPAHKHKYASGASFAGPGQFGVQQFEPRLVFLFIFQLAHGHQRRPNRNATPFVCDLIDFTLDPANIRLCA